MALEIVTSWKTLFQYAHKAGQARVAYKADPSEENKSAMDAAISQHDRYRDICLTADRMIGLEGVL